MISLIAAHDRNLVIGKGNSLPWSIPEDLQYFKQLTSGHICIMGRKTFESLGRPLPNRTNIILTSDRDYQVEGCYIYNSIEDVLNEYGLYAESSEVFVIGGSQIYEAFLPHADRMYITYIDHEFEGNAYFPSYEITEWELVQNLKAESSYSFDYYYQVYNRKTNKI